MKKLYMVSLALLLACLSFAQTANVQIIHNSPTPGTDTGPTVDIYVNDALLPELTGVPYRAATAFLEVPAGADIEVDVAVSPSNSADDAIATFPLGALEEGVNYTVIATGVVGDMDTPFDLAVNANARTEAEMMGMVDLNVYHGSTNAPAVDVDARTVGTLVPGLEYGNFTDYLSVEPQTYYLDVRAAGNPDIVATFEADLSTLGGGAATVFASGLLGATPEFGLFAALPDGTVLELPAASVARLQVIHNSPSPTVDIYANGGLLLDNFAFRTASEFIFVDAGVEINIGVALDNSTSVADTLVNFPVTFENGKTYVVAADGIVGDTDFPFTLHVNDMGQEAASDAESVAFATLHGSPGAPNVDVDIRTVGTIVEDLPYGSYTGYLEAEPGLYYLDVRAAGSPDIVATFEADLSGLGGGAATVFASGILGGDPAFGLFAALPDGNVVELPATAVARLQVIHNSPSPTVDVYANGGLLLDDFAFRTASEFIFVDAGVEINIGVALDNSTSVADTLVNFPVTFENGKTYVVAADGIVGDTDFPFTLHVNDMGQEAASDTETVAFAALHGSPGAPNVDIDIRTVGNIIEDLPYGSYTGYLEAEPGLYYLDVRAAGSPDIVATFEADLSGLGGGAATVFASGILGGEPAFGLFAALPDGTVVEFPATAVARVQIIHNSPSPTVDIYANGSLLLDDFAFQTATPFETLPAETMINIGVALSDSESVEDTLVNIPVMFENGETYVVFANGIVGDADNPFGLAVSAMGQEASTDPETLQVMAFHGSPGAPAVDINDSGDAPFITGLAYGAFTEGYLDLAGIQYFLEVRPAGADDLVGTFIQNLTGTEGLAAVVFASGIVGGDPGFNLLTVLPNGEVIPFTPAARVQIIHNSPAAAAASVDLWVNNAVKIEEDLDFQTATSATTYYPTRTPLTIGVAPADSDEPGDILFNVTEPVVFEDGKFNIIIANGIPGDADNPFELVQNTEGVLFSEDPAQVDVTVFHGSPGAPAVDVTARDLGAELVSDLAYGNFSGVLPIDPETYYLEITPGDSDALVATFESEIPEGLAGFGVTVVASGLLGDEPPFDLIAFSPLGDAVRFTPVAQVQVIHNSADPTVDVYANGDLLLNDFAYRTATPFVDLPTRTDIDLAVAGENSNSADDAIATFEDIRFNDGQKYVVMATGLVGNADTPFDLAVFDMAQTAAADEGVDLLLYHGSTDAPDVDVTVQSTVGVLFDDVAYGDYQGYVNVPAATYQLNVTPADDNNTAVKAYEADLTGLDGGAATVFATGFLGEADGPTAFGVWVALPDGTTFPLGELTSTREVDAAFDEFLIAPNPVRTQATVQFSINEPLQVTEEIRSLTGQVVYASDLGTQVAGQHNRTVEVSALPAGMYTYNLVTPLGTITRRLVVVK
ncbi:DUF4397 domain-containing protein [Phaeodactylibacter sp.]|uniref:DUF4397 domain-containing protein n=1 Tax=Phaeodactylibacter sp. TaxID=1940289 RepID=UPI0025EA122E|nr:DUF4397 domain-containing protein [Phaeodactylibacter sp.]MCI4649290.1 DUF4397 domain-containing protein [Phaeodactylibacter sp.]MCI5092062.1 DUF4397 domain-containing protein [Phaeodactylibacter sp.]